MAEQTNPPVARRTPLKEAITIIDGLPCALPGQETVALEACAGRISAIAIQPRHPVSHERRALADGYALAGLQTVGASPYNPLSFRLLGSAAPGAPFPGSLAPDSAVRIAMGATLPRGADAVLPPEAAQPFGDRIDVFDATGPGAWTDTGTAHRPGSDVPPFPAQRQLRAFDLALLAAQGLTELAVQRAPRVRILVLSTQPGIMGAGPGSPTPRIDASSPMIRALIARDGGVVEDCLRLDGDATTVQAELRRPGAELILTIGGTGMGFNDRTIALVKESGSVLFHGVSMRPGESVAAASLPVAPAILLPGDPVAAAGAYECLAARLVRRLAGRMADWPLPLRRARLVRKVSSALGVSDWCRVRFLDAESVEPLPLSGPPSLVHLAQADGFLLIPPDSEGHAPDSLVDIHAYA
ncbi:molybdopterin molybdotransferase MoeA [Thioalkalivibrio sp.]|uniref:molybdopterin molybdotransferase MoeA n=1 Tax=Thioalkalivibrio sp. TaxID=2093813 RepID=UPI0039757DB5